MKKIVLIKFTIKDEDPDSIFLEKNITKVIKISSIEDLETKILKKYPNFIELISASVIDTVSEPGLFITLEEDCLKQPILNHFIKDLNEQFAWEIKKIETINININ